MSNPEQERIDALEAYERETADQGRCHKRENSGPGLNEGMRELVRLLGLPEDDDELEECFRKQRLRRRVTLIAACVLPIVIGLVVASFMFGWR